MESASRDAERWDRVRHWRAVRVRVKRERVRLLREHRGCQGGGTPAANRKLARCMARRRGESWPCTRALLTRESSFNHRARNPSSGAYGLVQSLPASKYAAAGRDWLTNPRTQLRWFFDIYVPRRYGSVCAALAFHSRVGWY